jgi:hypothetical protein
VQFILVLPLARTEVNNLIFQLEHWPMLYPGFNTGSTRATYVQWFAAQIIIVLIVFNSRWSLLSYILVDSLGSILRRLQLRRSTTTCSFVGLFIWRLEVQVSFMIVHIQWNLHGRFYGCKFQMLYCCHYMKNTIQLWKKLWRRWLLSL